MTEFKEGDWVIGWHANWLDYKTKAWQIAKVEKRDRDSLIIPMKDKSHGTNSSSIRYATPEEIIKAEGQVELCYQVF